MLSLRDVLLNLNSNQRDAKDQNSRQFVVEAVFAELELQLKEFEETKIRKRRVENELLGRPDYSWLIDSKPGFKIPHNIRLELEELCRSVNPDQIHLMFREFRSLVDENSTPELICGYMRFTLEDNIRKNMHPGRGSRREIRKTSDFSAPCAERTTHFKTDVNGTMSGQESSRSISAMNFKSAVENSPKLAMRSQSAPLNVWRLIRKGKVVPITGVQMTELIEALPEEDPFVTPVDTDIPYLCNTSSAAKKCIDGGSSMV